MILETATFRSPIGTITLLAKEQALAGLDFGDRDARVRALRRHLERWLGPFELRKTRDPAGAVSRLRAYFAGEITALDSQPVVLLGTPFQVEVWTALRTIPAGRTWSYRNLAERLGRPQAQRAVGAANGRNPVSLFVPCHRVVASDGSLHGYGGGLRRKHWLLSHEGAVQSAGPERRTHSRAVAVMTAG